jgi:hypothetical protein
MQKLIKALEDMMVAITFAEAGEYDVARKISSQAHEEEVDAAINAGDLRAAKKA